MEGVAGAPRERRPGRLLAVLAIVGALAGGGACGGSSDADAPIRPVRTSDPAATFAPLVHLHSDEDSFPLSTKRFLAQSTLEWSGGACFPEVNLGAGPISQRITGEGAPRLDVARLGHAPGYRHTPRTRKCVKGSGPTFSTTQHTRSPDPGRPAGMAIDEGFHLDVLEEAYGGEGYRVERDREGQRVLAGVPAYYLREPERVAGKPGLRVSYWLLYARSESRGRDGKPVAGREGDWERIDVLARRTGAERYLPVAVVLQQDGRPRKVAWSDLERVADGRSGDETHPVVFSARSSHTPYPSAGSFSNRVEGYGATKAVAVDEAKACDDCPLWETWRTLRDARTEPWYGFGGGWGRKGESDLTSGPLGPSPFGG